MRVSLKRKYAGDPWLMHQLAIQLGGKTTYDEETFGVGARVAGRRPWWWRAWIETNGVQTLQHYRIHH